MILKDFAALDGIYKLHDGSDSAGMLGRVIKRAELRPDLGRMSCEIVLTKEIEDRSGDIVVVKGIDLSDHKRHPVALFNHDKDAPIGRFETPAGVYTVKTVGDALIGELYFNQKSAFAQDVFECVVDKTFTAASIGFLPSHGAINKRHPRGTHYGKSRLVEGSIVSLGDNPHAGVTAIHKALGRANASEVFKKYLTPLVTSRPATVTSGWEAKAMMSKDDEQQTTDPTAIAAGSQEEFMPQANPDAAADPNAVTADADPHADHKQTVDDASENVAASIFDKFTSGQIDRKSAMKLFDKILRHHEDIADISEHAKTGDDTEEEGFGDSESFDETDEDEDGDGDIDSADDAAADPDMEEDDAPPDLADKAKKRGEKAAAEVWITKYQPVIQSVYNAIGHVVREPDLDPQAAQAYLKKQMQRMQKLPEVDGMIRKALATPKNDSWESWEGTFFTTNGRH